MVAWSVDTMAVYWDAWPADQTVCEWVGPLVETTVLRDGTLVETMALMDGTLVETTALTDGTSVVELEKH